MTIIFYDTHTHTTRFAGGKERVERMKMKKLMERRRMRHLREESVVKMGRQGEDDGERDGHDALDIERLRERDGHCRGH